MKDDPVENQKEPGPLAASKCLVHVRGKLKKKKKKTVFKPSVQRQFHVAELSPSC